MIKYILVVYVLFTWINYSTIINHYDISKFWVYIISSILSTLITAIILLILFTLQDYIKNIYSRVK